MKNTAPANVSSGYHTVVLAPALKPHPLRGQHTAHAHFVECLTEESVCRAAITWAEATADWYTASFSYSP